MWHTMKASEIAALAKRWIDRVEAATGRPVIIYTNPTGWWNEVMTKEEDDLLADRAVWTSRYTRTGPAYVDGWERQARQLKMENGAIASRRFYIPKSIMTCRIFGSSQRVDICLRAF